MTVHWTVSHGLQYGYVHAAADWEFYHDLLPDINPNERTKCVCGIILKIQLFVRARDLLCGINNEKIQSDSGILKLSTIIKSLIHWQF